MNNSMKKFSQKMLSLMLILSMVFGFLSPGLATNLEVGLSESNFLIEEVYSTMEVRGEAEYAEITPSSYMGIMPLNTDDLIFTNFQFNRPIMNPLQGPTLIGLGSLSHLAVTNPSSFTFAHMHSAYVVPPGGFIGIVSHHWAIQRVESLFSPAFFSPATHRHSFSYAEALVDFTTGREVNFPSDLPRYPHSVLGAQAGLQGIYEVKTLSRNHTGTDHSGRVFVNIQETSSFVRVDDVENIALADPAPRIVIDPNEITVGRPAGYEHSGHFDINWRIEYADGTAWNEFVLDRTLVPSHPVTNLPNVQPGEAVVEVDLDPIRPIDWRRPGVNPPVEDGDAHSSIYARSEHGNRLQTGVVYTVRVNVREDVPANFPYDPTILSESIGRFTFTSPPTLDKFGSTDFAQVGETVTYTLRVENDNGVPLNDEFEVVDYIRTDLVALNGDFSPVTPTIGTPQTILLYDEDGNPWYDEDGVRLTGEVTRLSFILPAPLAAGDTDITFSVEVLDAARGRMIPNVSYLYGPAYHDPEELGLHGQRARLDDGDWEVEVPNLFPMLTISRLAIHQFEGDIDQEATTITFRIPKDQLNNGNFQGIITEFEADGDRLILSTSNGDLVLRQGDLISFASGDTIRVENGISYTLIIEPFENEFPHTSRDILRELIDYARAIDPGSVTVRSWSSMMSMVVSGEGVYYNSTATDAAIDEAIRLLRAAIDNLVER